MLCVHADVPCAVLTHRYMLTSTGMCSCVHLCAQMHLFMHTSVRTHVFCVCPHTSAHTNPHTVPLVRGDLAAQTPHRCWSQPMPAVNRSPSPDWRELLSGSP